MDDSQGKRRIAPCLADWRQHSDALEVQGKPRPATIGDLELVVACDSDFGHFRRHRVFPVPGQAIDASTDYKMNAEFLRSAKGFVNVVLTITDVK